MSSQALTPDPRYSHPARKYDKRLENGKNLEEVNAAAKRGPKPKRRSDLWGRRAVTHMRQMVAHKSPVQLYEDAIACKNYSLAWQILQDVETRALGRPYVAVNPDAVERHDQADVQRIAIAIKNLQIVNEQPAGKKPKAIEAAENPARSS